MTMKTPDIQALVNNYVQAKKARDKPRSAQQRENLARRVQIAEDELLGAIGLLIGKPVNSGPDRFVMFERGGRDLP